MTRDDATRIIRFCLAGTGWGAAEHDGDACVVKLVMDGPEGGDSLRFQGDSFDQALREAAAAGALKAATVEKQIAFMARSLPTPPGRWNALPTVAEEIVAEPKSWSLEPSVFQGLTATISALVHETQRERGVTSLYLSSRGVLFERELMRQWTNTDQRREDLEVFRGRNGRRLPVIVLAQIERAVGQLGRVISARDAIRNLELTVGHSIAAYTDLNQEILRVIDSLAQGGVDVPQRTSALAWMALSHAKEKTGLERALLASAFACDRFGDGQYQSLMGSMAASASYLHVFRAAAPQGAERLMREKLESAAVVRVAEMEEIALVHRDGGFGIDPTTWFATITTKMDMMGDVETAVRSTLVRS